MTNSAKWPKSKAIHGWWASSTTPSSNRNQALPIRSSAILSPPPRLERTVNMGRSLRSILGRRASGWPFLTSARSWRCPSPFYAPGKRSKNRPRFRAPAQLAKFGPIETLVIGLPPSPQWQRQPQHHNGPGICRLFYPPHRAPR